MSIFDSLVGSPYRDRYGEFHQNGRVLKEQRMNPMQMLGRLKANPYGALTEAGFTVPKDCKDAREMVKYLLDTNQVDNDQIQMIKNVVSSRRR